MDTYSRKWDIYLGHNVFRFANILQLKTQFFQVQITANILNIYQLNIYSSISFNKL